ncbi:MAG: hypothetical protein AB1584_18675 [Pseudomonadota bacterium]
MADSFDMSGQRTLNDIEVGARLVEALVHHLSKKGAAPIAYPALLELGRFLDPKDAAMDRAEPLGIAMKLHFVAEYCKAQGAPNLACLAVHPASGRPAFACAEDAGAERQAAAAFDWPPALSRLPDYVRAARDRVPARLKPRRERPAEVSWYAYFTTHREACKDVTSGDKKEVVNLVMAGLDPDTALRRFLAAKAAYEGAAV